MPLGVIGRYVQYVQGQLKTLQMNCEDRLRSFNDGRRLWYPLPDSVYGE